MSSVSTEGKLEWYLGGEYALRSIGAYLQLGFSLGAVQVRHACVPCKLAAYKAKCAWRHHVLGVSEDDSEPVYVDQDQGKSVSGQAAATGASVRAADGAATDPAAFLAELLAKFDAIAAITHAEAVEVRLLRRLMHQDILVCEQRRAQASQGHTDAADIRAKAHASEESIVFQLAESDTTYASVVAAGHPVAITYRDFVVLTTLLSEAIAWDLLWIHEGQDRQRAYRFARTSAAEEVEGGCVVAQQQHSSRQAPCTTEADCVALMLPNSVEYNALWMAAARSGPLHTFLDVLYRNSNSEQQPKAERGTYRPCRTALLNTNLASNAMLYHAIECSGSVMLVLDAAYVALLFRAREESGETEAEAEGRTDGAPTAAALELHVPPTVKRIYLWRSTDAAGQPMSTAMTSEMASQLRVFNSTAYGEAAAWKATTPADAHEAALRPATPPLDLHAAVSPFYTRAQATPSSTVESMRHTYLVSSPAARFLVRAVLARPPAAWTTLLSLRQPGSASASGGAATRKGAAAAAAAAPRATAAQSVKGRQQLRQYKTKLASILSRLLRRFHHTQPILFIYTSGTTGLPKAARFSHLRFFATGFLSRVLYYRDKIAETVVQQMDEVAYVAAHPGRVDAAGAAAGAGAPSEVRGGGGQGGTGERVCCPRVPDVFGIDSLDHTRRKRNTVEATFVAIFHVCLWWLRFFASLLGLEYYLTAFVERRRYTPAQMAAIEGERRLVTLYNCLPMYHTVGSVFCLGHLLHALEEQQHAWAQVRRCAPHATRLAATVPTVQMILRSKFSASQFRKDLQRYHVTVVQYIGEVLRYAVLFERAHPPVRAISETSNAATAGSSGSGSGTETELEALTALNRTTWRVPYAFGNGLRQDIWVECMRRLNIAHPVEFYSSTEGNIFLLNLYGMPGIVGHIPRFPWPIQWLSMQYFPIFPFRVLKFDEAAQQVYRDPETGYCAHCAVGDAGEVVGEVIEGFDMFALRRFDGYHKASRAAAVAAKSSGAGDHEEDRAARESKVIRRVLWPYRNDCYFLSGDLIRMDRYGFCTFVDRVGDTFRWKGENVSTLEVSNAFNSIHAVQVGVQEAVVYGVQLPGREGRAGMAMLSLQPRHVKSATSRAAHDTEGGAARNEKERGAGAAPSPSAPSTSLASLHQPLRLTLAEERRFLQNDLYSFLSGKTKRNGDGTASQAGLPAYAIPVLVRMQDPVADEDDEGAERATAAEGMTDSGSSTAGGAAAAGARPANKHAVSEDATQTSTFKYKKGTLMKQGYEFDGSSAVCTDIPAGAWGRSAASNVSGDGEAESAVATPYTRVYVLVTNPAAFKELALSSASGAAAGARPAGYVPLTPATREVLGEQLDKCGW